MTLTNHLTWRTRTGILAALLLVTGLMFGVYAVAQESTETTQEPATTDAGNLTQLQVSSAEGVGDFLTDAQGRSIYIFLNDTSGVSNCDEACQANWPPVRVAPDTDLATLAEGLEGVDASQLSTIELPDGSLQLVLNGWPLYYYAADMAAGDTTGQGVGDVWYLATPQGTGAGLGADQLGGGAAPQ